MAGIADVAKQAGIKVDEVKAAFTAVATLAADERVTIKGFGSFQFKTKAARTAKNPKTGEAVQVPEKIVLAFKAAK